jgi:hypothetical protein
MKKVILSMVFCLIITSLLQSYEKIKINDLKIGTGLYRAINREIYNRLNIEVEFITTPIERALNLSNSGIIDGELGRTKNVLLSYTNLRMVPTSIFTLKIYVYTKKTTIQVKSFDDLTNYSVAVLRGTKVIENLTRNLELRTANTIPGLLKTSGIWPCRCNCYRKLFIR